MSKEDSFLSDPHFQDVLLGFLVHDREFLAQSSHMLQPDDFKGITKQSGPERETVAEIALNFWNHYRQPVGKMLKVETIEYARKAGWKEEPKKRLLEFGEKITSAKNKRVAPDAALKKVVQYKTELELVKALDLMQDQLETGHLTMEEFLKIARTAAEKVNGHESRPTDIFANKELENRIQRRMLSIRRERFPVLMIDPLDRQIRIIARKHLGLMLAPWKRGKTMAFVWLALAYTLQGYNVFMAALEDPKEDMEERFDSAITNIPMSRLPDNPDRVREKFQRYKRLLRTRLKVYDGTDGQTTIAKLENIYEQERNRGFMADVILVDYDDEIRPSKSKPERRMEFADIYRDLRALCARHQLIGWTASQTSRKSEEMKIISGKHIAEDISKIRKAAFAMSLGKGDWGDDSIFVWVAAHRYDKQHIGAHIISSKDRSLFYDREKTLKRERIERDKEGNDK